MESNIHISDILKPKTEKEIIKEISKLSKGELNKKFFEAVKYNNSCLINLLIDAGANVNYSPFTIQAIHYIVFDKYLNLVEKLINAGANINHQDGTGWTPLHYAVYDEQIKCIKLLLKHHVIINNKTDRGKTPLNLAKELNNKYIIELLERHGAI